MKLLDANVGETYAIKDILIGDDEMRSFLFRLGCYSGEPITILSKKRSGCVVAIKDGKYNLDKNITSAIIV